MITRIVANIDVIIENFTIGYDVSQESLKEDPLAEKDETTSAKKDKGMLPLLSIGKTS